MGNIVHRTAQGLLMNILLLNGSPKVARSNTLKLASAFLEGMSREHTYTVTTCDIYAATIEHCRGCFACWKSKKGTCIIQDDMKKLLDEYTKADYIVWSLPLYYYGMPSKIKSFMDRLLPTSLPQIIQKEDGSITHLSRYDSSAQHHILISTCGFPSATTIFDALRKQFELVFKDRLTTIFCPQGELFSIPELKGQTETYLEQVQKAGQEYAKHGRFSPDTHEALKTVFFPKDAFIRMANAHWGEYQPEAVTQSQAPEDQASHFLQQMAATYKPHEQAHDVVLEMYFTDLEKTFQLILGSEACTLNTTVLRPYTTRIETPFPLWRDMSAGKIDGPKALMEQRYRVLGDFSVLRNMNTFFLARKDTAIPPPLIRTSMQMLLLPWVMIWMLLPINAYWAGIAALLSCALMPLLSFKYKLTVYDATSCLLVTLLSLGSILQQPANLVLCLSYLLFGGMWFVSGFARIPITAHYSCNTHGGPSAFANPLFIQTNRILSVAWGIVYLGLAVGSYFMLQTAWKPYAVYLNAILPLPMGIFTLWFIKWYPAQLAKRKIIEIPYSKS